MNDIPDNKSPQIGLFFTALNDLLNTIQQALQNRTPNLNGGKYLTNREVCQLLRISSRTLPNWRDTGEITFILVERKDSVQGVRTSESKIDISSNKYSKGFI